MQTGPCGTRKPEAGGVLEAIPTGADRLELRLYVSEDEDRELATRRAVHVWATYKEPLCG